MSIDPKVAATNQPYVFTNDNPLNGEDALGLKTNDTKIKVTTKAPTGKGATHLYPVVPLSTDYQMTITFTSSSSYAYISVQNNGSMGNGIQLGYGNVETVNITSNFGGQTASATLLVTGQVAVFQIPDSDAQAVNFGESFNYSVTINISGAATWESGENTVAVWTPRVASKPVYNPRNNGWWCWSCLFG